jgi:hypothetical protein
VRVQGWQTPVRNESDSGWTPAMAAQSAGLNPSGVVMLFYLFRDVASSALTGPGSGIKPWLDLASYAGLPHIDPRSFLTVKSKPKPNHDGERRWIYRYFVRKCTVTVSPLISASFYHDAFSNAAREPDLIQ